MKIDILSAIALKSMALCAIFLQLEGLPTEIAFLKYINDFGVVGLLLFGVRYFVLELKSKEREFLDRLNAIEAKYDAIIARKSDLHRLEIEAMQARIDALIDRALGSGGGNKKPPQA